MSSAGPVLSLDRDSGNVVATAEDFVHCQQALHGGQPEPVGHLGIWTGVVHPQSVGPVWGGRHGHAGIARLH
jgi:hypothetical protein